MSKYWSHRYGDLSDLARKTDSRCHLCRQEVDLALYGRPGTYGEHTVTVDHVLCQAHGGDDDADNLLLAHADCNSFRGTRDVELARYELTGETDAPLGTEARMLLSAGAGVAGYAAGGRIFATKAEDGTPQFNHGAAFLSALVTAVLVHELL